MGMVFWTCQKCVGKTWLVLKITSHNYEKLFVSTIQGGVIWSVKNVSLPKRKSGLWVGELKLKTSVFNLLSSSAVIERSEFMVKKLITDQKYWTVPERALILLVNVS